MAGNRFTKFGGRCWGVERGAVPARGSCWGSGLCSAGAGTLLDWFCLRGPCRRGPAQPAFPGPVLGVTRQPAQLGDRLPTSARRGCSCPGVAAASSGTFPFD